jgi:hypothetical protein
MELEQNRAPLYFDVHQCCCSEQQSDCFYERSRDPVPDGYLQVASRQYQELPPKKRSI